MAAVIRARRRHIGQRHNQLSQERVFCPRITLFQLSVNDIVKHYRLPSHSIITLLEDFKLEFAPRTRRSHSLPAVMNLLSTLICFCASGSFQSTVAAVAGISHPAFCSAMAQVLDALCRWTCQHIHFPGREQIAQTKQDFNNMANFPTVIGAIDCTDILLIPSSHNEHIFRNRKHTFH